MPNVDSSLLLMPNKVVGSMVAAKLSIAQFQSQTVGDLTLVHETSVWIEEPIAGAGAVLVLHEFELGLEGERFGAEFFQISLHLVC